MNKQVKIVSGWLGMSNEKLFFRDNSHPSTGLGDYITDLIQALAQKKYKRTIEVHFNAQPCLSTKPKYLILLEHKYIRPQNYLFNPRSYEKIFGWDLSLHQHNNFIYTRYPHSYSMGVYNQYRPLKYVMFCSNRNLIFGNANHSLYNKRHDVINFCEKNKMNFQLYGAGWEFAPVSAGVLNYTVTKLQILKKFRKNADLNCYRGIAKSKELILKQAQFNFCFENIAEYPGYVSEKIWDSLAAGTIPVYWPSWRIPEDYLPSDAYIDASKFSCMSSLFDYLESLPTDEVLERQVYCLEVARKSLNKVSNNNYTNLILEQLKGEYL
jgi:alpha(1,3/1,4) fucosyltransferase